MRPSSATYVVLAKRHEMKFVLSRVGGVSANDAFIVEMARFFGVSCCFAFVHRSSMWFRSSLRLARKMLCVMAASVGHCYSGN